MKNVLLKMALALGFSLIPLSASAAVVYVQAGPPAAVVETVPASPGAGYAWVGGYYRWNGTRYVWVHGHYAHHRGAWCGGHWHHTGHGYYWTEGHWC